MCLPGSHVLDRAGIRDSREQGLRYLAALVGPDQDGVDRARMEAFVRDSPTFARFLDDQGLALRHASGWSDYYAERTGGIDAGRTLYCDAFDLSELGEAQAELAPGRTFSGAQSVAVSRQALVTRPFQAVRARK